MGDAGYGDNRADAEVNKENDSNPAYANEISWKAKELCAMFFSRGL